MGVFYMDLSENSGTPKSSILGYHYFWKHPYAPGLPVYRHPGHRTRMNGGSWGAAVGN